jgi:hypothetical protein
LTERNAKTKTIMYYPKYKNELVLCRYWNKRKFPTSFVIFSSGIPSILQFFQPKSFDLRCEKQTKGELDTQSPILLKSSSRRSDLDLRELEIKEGMRIKLDDDAYDAVRQYQWRVIKPFMNQSKIVFETHKKVNKGRMSSIKMHRLIMGNPPKEYKVIFKNNDRLDLQKSNLCLVKNHTTWLRRNQNRLKTL